MKIKENLIYKLFCCFILINPFLNINKVQSADQIKITYSIFSRTISVKSLKNYSLTGKPDKNLKRLLRTTNTSNKEILKILNKNFDIPLPIASKLLYSEIGNVILTRISKVIHTPIARDEITGKLALRASIIRGLDVGEGKINIIGFFESYPTKTVILNASALSKILNKVESINELLEFFTNSPLNTIQDS
tara:strand:+ start:598 stop:1170 length:573 start_codon:yes stop_codon:yes gene_type:complete